MRAIPWRNTLESILTMNTSDPHVLAAKMIMQQWMAVLIKLFLGRQHSNLPNGKIIVPEQDVG